MFIKYKDISVEKIVDVRTVSEYKIASLKSYNVPIIDEREHSLLKKFYPIAFIIISMGIYKRRKYIKSQLINISHGRKYTIILACSRGRLRSPLLYFYCRMLGIRCKVLRGGIKPILKPGERKKLSEYL